MADTTSLGLTKPALNEFYDLLLQNGNLDLLDQLIAARIEKALVANNLLSDNVNHILAAPQGKVLKGLIDTTNDNLAYLTGMYKTLTDVFTLGVGTYYVSADCTNLPISDSCYLWINAASAEYKVIMAIPISNSIIYINRCNGGVWAGWKSVALS